MYPLHLRDQRLQPRVQLAYENRQPDLLLLQSLNIRVQDVRVLRDFRFEIPVQKCDIFVLFPRFCTSLQNRAVCYWKSVSFRHGRQPTGDKIQLLEHCPAARLLALGALC